jgi:translation initiation factor 4A
MQTTEKTNQKWDDFQLKTPLLRGIYSYGFETPSPIQSRAIPAILAGGDIIAQAQSGSGKTATFTIGILQGIDTTNPHTQAIILAPTRELAQQIAAVVHGISSGMPELRVKVFVGGAPIAPAASAGAPHLVVGTPGRVYDMLQRGILRADNVRIFTLDEADEMLSAGMQSQIYNIFQFLPQNVQVLLFSATLSPETMTVSENFMRAPTRILMQPEELSLKGIAQYYIAVQDDHAKFKRLMELYATISVSQCIIFCNSVGRAERLCESMTQEGFTVCCIHGQMQKQVREKVFAGFRNGTYRVLICTDLFARGIDLQQVSVVVNIDVPNDQHTFIHRVGRTSRFGRIGTAITFVSPRDIKKMREIENYYKIQLKEFVGGAGAVL